MHAGKMQTDYGRAVCEVLSAQVTWLFGRKLGSAAVREMVDLVEIKRVLAGMRAGILYGKHHAKAKEVKA